MTLRALKSQWFTTYTCLVFARIEQKARGYPIQPWRTNFNVTDLRIALLSHINNPWKRSYFGERKTTPLPINNEWPNEITSSTTKCREKRIFPRTSEKNYRLYTSVITLLSNRVIARDKIFRVTSAANGSLLSQFSSNRLVYSTHTRRRVRVGALHVNDDDSTFASRDELNSSRVKLRPQRRRRVCLLDLFELLMYAERGEELLNRSDDAMLAITDWV